MSVGEFDFLSSIQNSIFYMFIPFYLLLLFGVISYGFIILPQRFWLLAEPLVRMLNIAFLNSFNLFYLTLYRLVPYEAIDVALLIYLL